MKGRGLLCFFKFFEAGKERSNEMTEVDGNLRSPSMKMKVSDLITKFGGTWKTWEDLLL